MNKKIAAFHGFMLITTLVLLTGCSNPSSHFNPGENQLIRHPSLCSAGTAAVVTKIVDGDTINVDLPSGKTDIVRYIGIDTAEFGEVCFKEATRRNKELLEDSNIRLIRDTNNRDRYGRLVRYVCNSDNVFIDAQLVSDGLAKAFRFWPDVRFAEYFSELEEQAVENGKGCLHRRD